MPKIQLRHADRYVMPSGRMFEKGRVEEVTEREAGELLTDTTMFNGLKIRRFRLLPENTLTTEEVERREALAAGKAGKGQEDDLALDAVDIDTEDLVTVVPTKTAVPADDLDATAAP